jgi:3-isopropylmalate/(R)-2-methylmalate dehydratase small subunit
MDKFEKFTGTVAGIDRPNIDTDAIIPKQYLKSIKRTGFGINLFDDWRYLDPGEPGQDHSERRLNPDFVLNREPCNKAQILLGRENFACGSSREHAVWALMDFGIKVVIAPSFADIFYNNSFKNGLLPIALGNDLVEQMFKQLGEVEDYQLSVDLENQVVNHARGNEMRF